MLLAKKQNLKKRKKNVAKLINNFINYNLISVIIILCL